MPKQIAFEFVSPVCSCRQLCTCSVQHGIKVLTSHSLRQVTWLN